MHVQCITWCTESLISISRLLLLLLLRQHEGCSPLSLQVSYTGKDQPEGEGAALVQALAAPRAQGVAATLAASQIQLFRCRPLWEGISLQLHVRASPGHQGACPARMLLRLMIPAFSGHGPASAMCPANLVVSDKTMQAMSCMMPQGLERTQHVQGQDMIWLGP